MDKDLCTRFVGIFLNVLRAEIAETSARAGRLADAIGHNAASREAAQSLLHKVQAQRRARERHLLASVSGEED